MFIQIFNFLQVSLTFDRGKEHENGSGSRKEGERQVEEERTQEEVAGSTQEDQRSEIPEEEKGSGTEEEGSGIQDEKRKQENVAGRYN